MRTIVKVSATAYRLYPFNGERFWIELYPIWDHITKMSRFELEVTTEFGSPLYNTILSGSITENIKRIGLDDRHTIYKYLTTKNFNIDLPFQSIINLFFEGGLDVN